MSSLVQIIEHLNLTFRSLETKYSNEKLFKNERTSKFEINLQINTKSDSIFDEMYEINEDGKNTKITHNWHYLALRLHELHCRRKEIEFYDASQSTFFYMFYVCPKWKDFNQKTKT